MIQYNSFNATFIFALLSLFQINSIYAEPSSDIPDEIVNDWDEVIIEKDNEVLQQQLEQKQYEYNRQKALKNNSRKNKKNYKKKQLKYTKVKAKAAKVYKSPLHKPILYQKIYIRDKSK